MKKIKELNTIVYEVTDLKGETLEKAIQCFLDDWEMFVEPGEELNLTREETIIAISEQEYYFDIKGEYVPIDPSYNETGTGTNYSLYLTDNILVPITLEEVLL